MKRIYYLSMCLVLLSLISFSCNKDDNLFERVYWKLFLNPQSQVPAVNRAETAVVRMQLLSDNTLIYNITVSNLDINDSLITARMHAGDPLTVGGSVVLDFHPNFEDGVAKGSMIVSKSLVDSLVDLSNQLYINVSSFRYPEGLLRGQVQTDVLFAADIDLAGANNVPPVVTLTTGKAFIRLTSDNKLFTNVSVFGLDGADTLTKAQLNWGSAELNGTPLIELCSKPADFGVNQVFQLKTSDAISLMTKDSYVNVFTSFYATGLLRGQLVNSIKQNNIR